MVKKLFPLFVLAAVMTSCGTDGGTEANPLLSEWDTPFGMPPFEKIKPEHFKPAIEEGMRREKAEIEAILVNEEEPGFENVILAYDNSGELLSRVRTVFSGLNSANTNPELQAVDEEITPMLSKHSNEIRLDPRLFAKVKAVYDNRESLGLDAEQSRLLEKMYKGFIRSGADLDDEKKERLKELNDNLSMLSLTFGKNLLADKKEFQLVIEDENDLSGLPQSVRDAAAIAAEKNGLAGKWVFTLDKPSWIPFLQYSDNRELREKLYKGYLNMADNDNEYNNRQVVADIIKYRVERARLVGYPTYSHYVLDEVMAGSPEKVYELIDQMWTPALNRAKEELEEMRAIKIAEGGGDDFESWDWWYYAEKVRKEKYDLDETELRAYFPLDAVRDGMFLLANKLYGITFRPVEAPKYHEDNQIFECLDKDGSHLGLLNLDFFPRAGKRSGAWCGSYRPQSYENGVRVAPLSTIVCNFTPPTGDSPALLSIDEVETMFHEFGHALHGLFSDVKYKGLRRTERDFVELPSQVMENWATEPEFLRMYAKHYRTGAVIPDELIDKITATAQFNMGFITTELQAASLIDMAVHSLTSYEPFDVIEFQDKILAERGLISEIEPRYRFPYFNHIFNSGYASGYYSYTWSEVLDADAFEAFLETGNLFDPETAARFRTLLASGGSKDGMSLYLDFRGAEPSRIPLLKRRGLL